MATDPFIPFPYLAVGQADSGKTGANFDQLVKYIRDRNDGTAQWDKVDVLGTLDVDGASTLTSPVTVNGAGSTTELRLNNTATDGDPVILWQLSGTSIFRAGVDDSASDVFEIGRGSTFGTTTDLSINQSTGAVSIRGTNTNDSPAAGFVGELVEAKDSAKTNFPATTVWGDANSISLTAGHWLVSAQLYCVQTGATWTLVDIGISTNSGNNGAGLSDGDNLHQAAWASSATTPTFVPLTIAGYSVKLTSTTTYYLKVRANYTAGTPQYSYMIRAIRIR